jgi:hypothetical protein
MAAVKSSQVSKAIQKTEAESPNPPIPIPERLRDSYREFPGELTIYSLIYDLSDVTRERGGCRPKADSWDEWHC